MGTIPPNVALTKREREILSLAGRGLTNQHIGNELGISSRTVKSTLHRVCIKLGAKNRGQAVIRAISLRAIGIQEVMSLEEWVDLLESLGPELLDTVVQSLNSKYEPRKVPVGVERILDTKSL